MAAWDRIGFSTNDVLGTFVSEKSNICEKFAKVRETFDLSDEGPTIFSKIFWWGAPASPGPSLHVGGGVVSPQRAFESASGLTVYWFWIPNE